MGWTNIEIKKMRVCGKDSCPFPYDLILGGIPQKIPQMYGKFLTELQTRVLFWNKISYSFSILSIVPLKLTKLDIFYLTHCSVKCA